jgi:hypothetical protein
MQLFIADLSKFTTDFKFSLESISISNQMSIKMDKMIVLPIFLFLLLSCNKQVNVFQTGSFDSEKYFDSIEYADNSQQIVLSAKVDGKPKRMVFDSGADLMLLTDDVSSNSKIIVEVNDVSGKKRNCEMSKNDVTINKLSMHGLFSLNLKLPEIIMCCGGGINGVIGNNLIRSSDWLINKNKVYYSNKPFKLKHPLVLNTFYYSANRLHINALINNLAVDTCLVDYGGFCDMKLPLYFYVKHMDCFKPNYQYYKIKSTIGANGKSEPDTVLHMNCNVDFNGVKIDSVVVEFYKKTEKTIGVLFLKRFANVAINNSDYTLLLDQNVSSKTQRDLIYSFDLVNGTFEVDSKVLINDSVQLEVGNKFIEINSKKPSDFGNYCEFLKWRDNFFAFENLELKSVDNRIIKVKNWY